MSYTNADWVQGFVLTDVNGAAIDLTGADLRMTMRANASDTAALLSLTVGAGITITIPTEGKFEISATKATMAAIPVGVYPFDIMRVTAGVWDPMVRGFNNHRQGVS